MFKQILIPVCLYLYHISAASVQKAHIQFAHIRNADMIKTIQCCRMAEINVERRPEEPFKMIFIRILRQEAEYASSVVGENNYINTYPFRCGHKRTFHFWRTPTSTDNKSARPAQGNPTSGTDDPVDAIST